MRKAVAVVALVGLVGGCSVVGQTPTQKEELAILSAGDLGSVSCAILKGELSPEDLVKAKASAKAAKTVLADPEPSLADIQAALETGVPAKFAGVGAVIVQRVKIRLDGANALPKDSLGWKIAEAAITACQDALG